MNSWAQGEGQPGLGYIFWSEDQGAWGGPIAKNLGGGHRGPDDGAGHGAGRRRLLRRRRPEVFYKFAGSARTKLGRT
jgi:aspartyl-tRNA synthetase